MYGDNESRALRDAFPVALSNVLESATDIRKRHRAEPFFIHMHFPCPNAPSTAARPRGSPCGRDNDPEFEGHVQLYERMGAFALRFTDEDWRDGAGGWQSQRGLISLV